MGKYIVNRLLLILPTAFILSLIVFAMLRVLPGDVAVMVLSGGADVGGSAFVDEIALRTIREELGLNAPLPVQYLNWIWDMLRGDLGTSLLRGHSVAGEILLRLPITLELAILAKLIALAIGIPLGVISAVKQNSWIDQVARFWSVIFLAVPGFWLALMVILAGALWFNYFPAVGYNPIWAKPVSNIQQMFFPALLLGVGGMATMARMTRSTMLEVMREDYIRTARAKGLRERVVIVRHALKNAMIPVITLAGLSFAGLLGGTVIIEQIFAIPGMGLLFLNAIQQRDYPVVQGVVVIFALMFMFINLVVDLAYGWLDPRVSYS